MRSWRARTLTAAVITGVLAGFALATPASAANRQRSLRSVERTPATMSTGTPSSTVSSEAWLRNRTHDEVFTIEDKGTYDGKPQVKFLNGWGMCLDTRGASGTSSAWFTSCNAGDYQLWQVFTEGGAKVYKNKGSWTHQSRHLCLSTIAVNRAVIVETCFSSLSRQQWTELAP